MGVARLLNADCVLPVAARACAYDQLIVPTCQCSRANNRTRELAHVPAHFLQSVCTARLYPAPHLVVPPKVNAVLQIVRDLSRVPLAHLRRKASQTFWNHLFIGRGRKLVAACMSRMPRSALGCDGLWPPPLFKTERCRIVIMHAMPQRERACAPPLSQRRSHDRRKSARDLLSRAGRRGLSVRLSAWQQVAARSREPKRVRAAEPRLADAGHAQAQPLAVVRELRLGVGERIGVVPKVEVVGLALRREGVVGGAGEPVEVDDEGVDR
eukprot:6202683-Pleurochrysis_carterae.AAC.2